MTLIEESLLKDALRPLIEEALIEEAKKQTLKELIENFKDVFPNSSYGELNPARRKVYGEDTLELKIVTEIKSGSSNKGWNTVIVVRRTELDDPWTVDMPCEVKCACPAFKYYTSNANFKSKNFYGRPDKWATTRPEKNNLKGTPSMCKHLMRAAEQAVKDDVIEM